MLPLTSQSSTAWVPFSGDHHVSAGFQVGSLRVPCCATGVGRLLTYFMLCPAGHQGPRWPHVQLLVSLLQRAMGPRTRLPVRRSCATRTPCSSLVVISHHRTAPAPLSATLQRPRPRRRGRCASTSWRVSGACPCPASPLCWSAAAASTPRPSCTYGCLTWPHKHWQRWARSRCGAGAANGGREGGSTRVCACMIHPP